MKVLLTAGSVLLLCAGTLSAQLHGTYTVKPDSTGDFVTIYEAGYALMTEGISGDCVFEVYGDSVRGELELYDVPGSDSWTMTFRPGPGQRPVLVMGMFHCRVSNLKVENLEFIEACANLSSCRGCRISGCRLTDVEIGVVQNLCAFDTIIGNAVSSPDWADDVIYLSSGHDNVVANNMVCGSVGGERSYGLVMLDQGERRTKVYYNTLRYLPLELEDSPDLHYGLDAGAADVRNNLFILASPADTLNGCVGCYSDSLLLDYNCYYVESLGHIGLTGGSPPTRLNWSEWQVLGFEPHGLNADPLVSGPGNLHLRQGSPCIGAGVPIPGFATDIDGDPRDPVHPCIGADEYTGGAVTEQVQPVSPLEALPTIVRGVLELPEAASRKPQAASWLLDIPGRKVAELHPGPNDVSRFAPGVYFVRSGLSAVSREPSAVHKVVITQ